MPRDGSGVYTLPAGNPVVTNTVIASAWANQTMSDIAAQLNNVFTRDGLLGPTGPFKLMDGTVAAPGLAWNSEPGLGWYRSSASVIGVAAQGARIAALTGATSTNTGMFLNPRAPGISLFQLANDVVGAANYHAFSMSVGPASMTLAGTPVGAAGPIGMYFTNGTTVFFRSPQVQIEGVGAVGQAQINLNKSASGQVNIIYGMTNGSPRWNLQLGAGGAETGSNAGSDFAIDRLSDTGAYLGTPMFINRATGDVTFQNTVSMNVLTYSGPSRSAVNNLRNGGNVIYIGWNEGWLDAQVDTTYFGTTWPINISGTSPYAANAGQVNGISGWNYSNRGKQPVYLWVTDGSNSDQYLTTPGNLTVAVANAVNGITFDLVSAMGFASGDNNIPYMRRTGQPDIRRLLWQTVNDDTVRSLRLTGINPGVNAVLEISGVPGAWGVTVNASDERLKSNIAPSSVNGIAALEAMELIEYDAGEVHEKIGFRAQNLQAIDERMVFGVDQPEGSPFYELGTILNPNDHVVLAYVAKAVKELINRVTQLENA